MKAKKGDTVKVHYAGKLKSGHIFDTSRNRDMLKFTIGERRLLSMFEDAVIGMSPGEIKTIDISAMQAYGQHMDELLLTIDRSKFPPGIVPKVGLQVEIGETDGPATSVIITEVTDRAVTIDANHPLAGQDLIFDIELVEIVLGQGAEDSK